MPKAEQALTTDCQHSPDRPPLVYHFHATDALNKTSFTNFLISLIFHCGILRSVPPSFTQSPTTTFLTCLRGTKGILGPQFRNGFRAAPPQLPLRKHTGSSFWSPLAWQAAAKVVCVAKLGWECALQGWPLSQNTTSSQEEPVSSCSKTDPSLPKPEAISDVWWHLCTAQEEEGEKACKKE